MFNPVVDVYKNWRNTIVNTRSFGSDPDTVLENARAYIRGIKDANPNMACTAKHFPGDGVEELDQHLVRISEKSKAYDEGFKAGQEAAHKPAADGEAEATPTPEAKPEAGTEAPAAE